MNGPAFARMTAVQPALAGVRPASAALGLGARELLHAGPPLRDARQPPPVLLSSAVVTLLHEGWARDEASAEAMVRNGTVALAPAQPRGCVVPLAGVVSPGTPLFEVRCGESALYAPVSTVRGPDTRMGFREAGLAARLHHRDTHLAPAWQALLARTGPLPLLPLAAHGLAHGDDLHGRTTAANEGMAQAVRARGDAALADELAASPLFFLTIWMAACALMLRAAEGGGRPMLVTRAGGNGERFGIALAARPHEWICTEAAPPRGPRLAGAEGAAVCPAIGDSAVIDMLGLGGMALDGAPEVLQAFGPHAPADHATLAADLLGKRHPVLQRRVGLDAAQVVRHGRAPLVALAMLAADGRGGAVGRGLYRPPLALFEQALAAVPG